MKVMEIDLMSGLMIWVMNGVEMVENRIWTG